MFSIKGSVLGVPYGQDKARGDLQALGKWTEAIKQQTADLPMVKSACVLRVTFRLPPDKFPADCPFGNDLDNLLKRFCDAMNETVFQDAPGHDSCIVALEAAKGKARPGEASGADFEIIIF